MGEKRHYKNFDYLKVVNKPKDLYINFISENGEELKMEEKNLLVEELKTYESKKQELLSKSEGKYVLIKNSKIIGIYDSQEDAIKIGIEKFGNVPFLVKRIELLEQKQNFTSNLIRCELKCHR